MADASRERVSTVLRVLADLAPANETRQRGLTIPTDWFRWLPASAVSLFTLSLGAPPSAESVVDIDRTFGEQLASVDRIRPQQHSLRLGWLFVAGTLRGDDGRRRRTFRPLVTMPVRVELPPLLGRATLRPVGDVSISNLIDDPAERQALEARMQFGGGALVAEGAPAIAPALLARLTKLSQFARTAASAASLPASVVVPVEDAPDQLADREGLVIVAGVGVYATHEPGSVSRAGSLRGWADGPLDRWTSFHSLYLDDDGPPAGGPASTEEPVVSPYLLTPVQRRAVVRSRTEPVTLVSGAPGTGKSHTVVAIACDAITRGQSVLVAAKSDATVDALIDLLERTPGPEPVVFGSNERRTALAERLAGGQLVPLDDAEVEAARHACEAATTAEARARRSIEQLLTAEAEAEDPGSTGPDIRQAAPGFFTPEADIPGLLELLDEVLAPAEGWWSRRRRRRRAACAPIAGTGPVDAPPRRPPARAPLGRGRAGGATAHQLGWPRDRRTMGRAARALRTGAGGRGAIARRGQPQPPAAEPVHPPVGRRRRDGAPQRAGRPPDPARSARSVSAHPGPAALGRFAPRHRRPPPRSPRILRSRGPGRGLLDRSAARGPGAPPSPAGGRRRRPAPAPPRFLPVGRTAGGGDRAPPPHRRTHTRRPRGRPTEQLVRRRRGRLTGPHPGRALPFGAAPGRFRGPPPVRRHREGRDPRPSTCDEDCVDVVRLAGTRDRTGVVEAEVTAALRELRSLLAAGSAASA